MGFHDPSSYLSAPTSPDNLQFYSAPTSPLGRIGDTPYGFESDDDFEFETSSRFANGWRTEFSPTFERPSNDDQGPQQQITNHVQRTNSFPTMSFADELFCDGQVLPLKLPPRFQQGTQDSQGSIPTSPKSPSSVLRIPFVHRSTWNDNFDPFVVALEKVSNETRGRKSIHRRARSHSPFRTMTLECSDGSEGTCNQGQQKQADTNLVVAQMQQNGVPNSNEMVIKAKGSLYARWVRSQTMEHKRSSSVVPASSKYLTKAKTSLFGRSPRDEYDAKRPIMKKTGKNDVGFSTETKMQKMKSILLKYTSLGKENNPCAAAAMRNPSNHFKKLSFKFKGSEKKKVSGESKIRALVKYNTKRPLCLGYVPASPTHS